MLKSETEMMCEEIIWKLKRMISEGKYQEAVSFGMEAKRRITSETDQSYANIAYTELDVYYALALIYTGATEQGIMMLQATIAELEGRRKADDVAWQSDRLTDKGSKRNWVLGRAHNNLGYAYWINQGRCKSDLREEYANTYDNIGRVYALLYQRDQAECWIDSGLVRRRELKHDYRIALSLNSRAIAHLRFGEPHQAYRLGIKAFSIFENLDAHRGIGLACITLGRSLRQLGTLTDLYSAKKCGAFLKLAVTYLNRAVDIFEQSVYEPVRLIEAYNELGCTYRDQMVIARHVDSSSPLIISSFHRYPRAPP